jgi:hypothetical protein
MHKVALWYLVVAAGVGCGGAGEANPAEPHAFRLEAGVLVEVAPGVDNVQALYCSSRCDFGTCGCSGDGLCCATACHQCNIDCGENGC